MDEYLFQVNISSIIITAVYDKLIKYSYSEMEDTLEYKEYIEKLKKYINVETEIYNNINEDLLNKYFEAAKKVTKFEKNKDVRIYNRMNDRMRVLKGNQIVDGILLSSIISSKLIIDNLHYVNQFITELTPNGDIDDKDILMLNFYNKRMKYHYLTANSYIESKALEYNFNIDQIASYSFQNIEKKYGVKFISSIKEILLKYVITSINELADLKSMNKYLLSYLSIFEIGRIEAILPYLSIEDIDKILELYQNDSYKYDSNGALRKVKKIIYKKKEEFN